MLTIYETKAVHNEISPEILAMLHLILRDKTGKPDTDYLQIIEIESDLMTVRQTEPFRTAVYALKAENPKTKLYAIYNEWDDTGNKDNPYWTILYPMEY
jgi:hypothetical protein